MVCHTSNNKETEMDIPDTYTVHEIWARSTEGIQTIAFLDRLEDHPWDEHAWRETTELPVQPHGCDYFFSVRRFGTTGRGRTNDNATLTKVLFADLDGVDPTSLIIRPSIWWETTPYENWQAVWFTKLYMTNEEQKELNKDLTYMIGADKGGWHASKMLRVPRTTNWKRGGVSNVEVNRGGPEYNYSELRSRVPSISLNEAMQRITPTDETLNVAPEHPTIPEAKDHEWLLRLYWPEMSLMARSMIVKMRPVDRSWHIVKLIKELYLCGFNEDSIWQLLWNTDFNKWRHRPERLWTEICKLKEYYRPR
jgi:hypothetical protein